MPWMALTPKRDIANSVVPSIAAIDLKKMSPGLFGSMLVEKGKSKIWSVSWAWLLALSSKRFLSVERYYLGSKRVVAVQSIPSFFSLMLTSDHLLIAFSLFVLMLRFVRYSIVSAISYLMHSWKIS
jgi:hypothetical protein